ncbi:4-oxalomesaconate tautomerase [Nocardioides terrae]|uniref:4-oxalomesaconate tautomerase n=1 Tax=Nocardioides terrae TaxID=574651 RepID=A0A1I1H3G4_9ACTN|nr:PrpF domain-containing protein [Nocardioides terrae]SFC18699.1 4-oxalomesaconate tautomerase [Nocardioides terrae]
MTGVPCALMRGGTSKGGVFLASDLPSAPAERDGLLLRLMGSPDPRQIDGLGGAHPLTSKVAVVSPSTVAEADVDYLFLQVVVDEPVVTDSQTCGNMLAAVAPFAISHGLVRASDPVTSVRVRLVNTGAVATLRVRTPDGAVTYDGDTALSGVPGTAAPVEIDVAPSGRPLLPTGRALDVLAGVEATCVDNGMPSVVVRATDLGVRGDEPPAELEDNADLTAKVREIRAAAMTAMGLSGDLEATTVPKIVLVSPPRQGGTIATRSFIPLRVHQAIGVLGAASVAAAVALRDGVAAGLAASVHEGRVRLEHPTGFSDLVLDGDRTTVVRTARLIMEGVLHPAPARSKES